MNYLSLNLWLLISTIVCNAIVVAVTQDQGEEQDSEELQNSLVKSVRTDYSHGFQEMLTLFDSMNRTMIAMMGKIQDLEATVAKINDESKTRINNILKFVSFNSIPLQTGKTFNGSSLPEIISRVSSAGWKGHYTAVVFANYLDETINDFTIYDKNNATFNPAPASIPPHTEEVFTFYEPSLGPVETSFSYVIPSNNVRIAAISAVGAFGAGLAFLSNGADMKTYYASKTGLNGSSVYECCGDVNRITSVGYQDLHARLIARAEDEYKATLRIELIKFA